MSRDCRVYWGSHGCMLERGHDGDCECDCGDGPPYYGPRTVFYGEDVEARGLNTDPNIIESCSHCGGPRQNERPDPCLGMLPNAYAACCGHGDDARAYVALRDGGALYGDPAVAYFTKHSAAYRSRGKDTPA